MKSPEKLAIFPREAREASFFELLGAFSVIERTVTKRETHGSFTERGDEEEEEKREFHV